MPGKSFSVLLLNFSGLKSSKLTNFAGLAHNVLPIFNYFTSFILYYTFCKISFININFWNKFIIFFNDIINYDN